MLFGGIPNGHFILILGAPRSGTTWLAKIFDSHPDVLYRHEPDTRAPDYCPADAATYFRELVATQWLKSSGSLPVFAKTYRPGAGRHAHRGLIYALRAADKFSAGALRNMPLPDLFTPAAHPNLRVVVKSVSFRLRLRALLQAMPGLHVVFIVRDPFGQVASMLRGTRAP